MFTIAQQLPVGFQILMMDHDPCLQQFHCLEGAIIALACIIFSVFASSPPAIGDTSLSAVTIVWNYVGELVFNLLVLVGAVKASDRIVKEIMGL